jgi:hypothetical protein
MAGTGPCGEEVRERRERRDRCTKGQQLVRNAREQEPRLACALRQQAEDRSTGGPEEHQCRRVQELRNRCRDECQPHRAEQRRVVALVGTAEDGGSENDVGGAGDQQRLSHPVAAEQLDYCDRRQRRSDRMKPERDTVERPGTAVEERVTVRAAEQRDAGGEHRPPAVGRAEEPVVGQRLRHDAAEEDDSGDGRDGGPTSCPCEQQPDRAHAPQGRDRGLAPGEGPRICGDRQNGQ